MALKAKKKASKPKGIEVRDLTMSMLSCGPLSSTRCLLKVSCDLGSACRKAIVSLYEPCRRGAGSQIILAGNGGIRELRNLGKQLLEAANRRGARIRFG